VSGLAGELLRRAYIQQHNSAVLPFETQDVRWRNKRIPIPPQADNAHARIPTIKTENDVLVVITLSSLVFVLRGRSCLFIRRRGGSAFFSK